MAKWQKNPEHKGFYWLRGVEKEDVIVEVTFEKEGTMIKRHGRSTKKSLDDFPRKARFQAIMAPSEDEPGEEGGSGDTEFIE